MVETLPTLLQNIVVVIPSHVKRKAKKIVDYLSNVGMETMEEDISDTWHNVSSTSVVTTCITLSQRDWTHHLDWVRSTTST